ncbi:hypothetical protein ACT6QH_08405 [Xanthobacter sp. TB0139]|uniref:hypothetical protein n=1 Tax=Xanthobacter sp. TB0139 TaxID=3459178 RepID=UPI00403A7417
MPTLVKFLVTHAVIGVSLAVVFVGALVAFDVANLGTLVRTHQDGYLAAALLVGGLGITFGSVQMGFAVMLMNGGASTKGGHKARLRNLVLRPVKVEANSRR